MNEKNWQLMDELNALKQKVDRWGNYRVFNGYREEKRKADETPPFWRLDAPEISGNIRELKNYGFELERIVGYGKMSIDEIEEELKENSPPCFV